MIEEEKQGRRNREEESKRRQADEDSVGAEFPEKIWKLTSSQVKQMACVKKFTSLTPKKDMNCS